MGQPLRDYERAILEVLADGAEHDKESLRDAGVRACSSGHALGQYQRDNRDESLAGLSVEEHLRAVVRQEVKGAKILVGKALSHLVDRNLMEVTEWCLRGDKSVRTRDVAVTAQWLEEGKAVNRILYRITENGEKRLKVNDADPKAVEAFEAERRSETVRKQWAKMTPEQRAQRASNTWKNTTHEERSERSRKAAETRRDKGEDISETNRRGKAKMTPEERSEASRKSAETRRRKRSGAYFEQSIAMLFQPPSSARSRARRGRDPVPFNDMAAALGRNDLMMDGK